MIIVSSFIRRHVKKPCLISTFISTVCLMFILRILERPTLKSRIWMSMSAVGNSTRAITSQYFNSSGLRSSGSNLQQIMKITKAALINQIPVSDHTMKPKIPHILHQTWDSYMVPTVFKSWIHSWIKRHPHWEYWFWTPAQVKQLLRKYYPRYLGMYNKYPEMIKKTDAMRYFIMERYGGVYADLDLECLKNIDVWTYNYSCFLSEETYEHAFLLYKRARSEMMTTILACRPFHPFYNFTIRRLPASAGQRDVLHATGPFFLDAAYLLYNATTHNQKNLSESDRVASIIPDYFLPTYDKGLRFHINCQSTLSARRTKLQNLVCAKLIQQNFRNAPTPYSFTNHHWFHVMAKHARWKDLTPKFNIKDLVPNLTIPVI